MGSKMRCEKTGVSRSLGRRDLMKSGAGLAAVGMISAGKANAEVAEPCPTTGELFAFRAPDADRLVFAVAFPVSGDSVPGAAAPSVRIHAGLTTWTADGEGSSRSSTQGQAGARIYAGHVSKPTLAGDELHHLIVVSAPTASLSAGVLAVWAEAVGQGGSRLRIGNPIVAELLAQEPTLATLFHRAHPANDHTLFAEALADRIAARGATVGVRDPKLHGKRLAAMLLPDVLPFDPEKPVGFTFVGQNGRRPSDAVATIIDTVLAGAVGVAQPPTGLFTPSKVFPYFQTAVV